jgi:hypothetical protein
MVMAGAVIGTKEHTACGVLVNAGAAISHHARDGAFVHPGVGACIAGGSVPRTSAIM